MGPRAAVLPAGERELEERNVSKKRNQKSGSRSKTTPSKREIIGSAAKRIAHDGMRIGALEQCLKHLVMTFGVPASTEAHSGNPKERYVGRELFLLDDNLDDLEKRGVKIEFERVEVEGQSATRIRAYLPRENDDGRDEEPCH